MSWRSHVDRTHTFLYIYIDRIVEHVGGVGGPTIPPFALMNTAHACGVTIDRSVRSVRSVRPTWDPTFMPSRRAGFLGARRRKRVGRQRDQIPTRQTRPQAPGRCGPTLPRMLVLANNSLCRRAPLRPRPEVWRWARESRQQHSGARGLTGFHVDPRPPSTSHQRGSVWGRLNRSFWALARAGWWRTAQYKGCQRTRCLLPQAKPSHNLAVSCTGVMYSP